MPNVDKEHGVGACGRVGKYFFFSRVFFFVCEWMVWQRRVWCKFKLVSKTIYMYEHLMDMI